MTFTFVHSEIRDNFLFPFCPDEVLLRQKAGGIIGVIPLSAHTHSNRAFLEIK